MNQKLKQGLQILCSASLSDANGKIKRNKFTGACEEVGVVTRRTPLDQEGSCWKVTVPSLMGFINFEEGIARILGLVSTSVI